MKEGRRGNEGRNERMKGEAKEQENGRERKQKGKRKDWKK